MGTEILVAIITAITGFIALVLTKEQKVSEFRQTWVDALREDVAQLMSLLVSFKIENQENAFIRDDNHNLKGRKSEILPLKDVDRFKPLIVLHSQRLILRLNKQEHNEVIDLLKKIPESLPNPNTALDEYKKFDEELSKIESKFHQVLKTEWNRVKKGEPWFKFTKVTLGIFIFLVLAVNLIEFICQYI